MIKDFKVVLISHKENLVIEYRGNCILDNEKAVSMESLWTLINTDESDDDCDDIGAEYKLQSIYNY